MRTWLSIFLLAVFLTAQYARQFAYLQCKMASMGTLGLQGCDCAELTDLAKMVDDSHPVTQGHVHLALDEFFAPPNNSQSQPIAILSHKPIPLTHIAPLLPGCCGSIDRPPQSYSFV